MITECNIQVLLVVIWEIFLTVVSFVLSTAKSTELLPNSQEGSKRIPSVHSSANAANQSSGTVGFEEGEPDNLGMFEVYRQIHHVIRFLRNTEIPLNYSVPLQHVSSSPVCGHQYLRLGPHYPRRNVKTEVSL